MCLISFAYRVHPDFPLIVAANRDEFLNRETAPADYWDDYPEILAGRDLQAGGTWMGVTTAGRFAAVTNYRDPSSELKGVPSRGELVTQFLRGTSTSELFPESAGIDVDAYNGFNLLTFDGAHMGYMSNTNRSIRRLLAPGIYGLSNHLLDTPWPKVQLAKSSLEKQVSAATPDTENMLGFLRDDRITADELLPSTGVPLEIERALSASFIRFPGYGTRSSTVIIYGMDGSVTFTERTFDVSGASVATRKFVVDLKDQISL